MSRMCEGLLFRSETRRDPREARYLPPSRVTGQGDNVLPISLTRVCSGHCIDGGAPAEGATTGIVDPEQSRAGGRRPADVEGPVGTTPRQMIVLEVLCLIRKVADKEIPSHCGVCVGKGEKR